MKKNTKPKVSLLALAKRSPNICLEITPDDLQRHRPAWSRQEAEDFLQRYKGDIAQGLLGILVAVLERLIDRCESEARYDN